MAKNILDLSKRKYVLGGIACGIILIYIIQLFNLQVLNPEYKDFADGETLLSLPQPPDAILAMNDTLAFAAMEVIKNHGLRIRCV